MSKSSRVRLATKDDLERDCGSGRLLIGFPVRPKSSDDSPSTSSAEQSPAEEEQSSND